MKSALRSWFVLRPVEQGWIAALLAIVLLGLLARHLHLRAQEVPPPGAGTPDMPAGNRFQDGNPPRGVLDYVATL